MAATAVHPLPGSQADRDALRIWGTLQPVAPSRWLSAGELSCEWSEGSIRNLRWRGVELIRGIAYLLRDRDWGTAPSEVDALSLEESPSQFVARFGLTWSLPEGRLRAAAEVRGDALGQFSFQVDAVAETDLTTNRCGLVVLHPASAAGAPLTIEHTDGQLEAGQFPELISPGQVAFNIRSLRHVPVPGLNVLCRLEAELPHDPLGKFEMEDQRNWSDASFKTYVASLLDPWPYVLPAKQRHSQQVNLLVTDNRPAAPEGPAADVVPPPVTLGQATGLRLPAMGLGVPLGLRCLSSAEHRAVVSLKPAWLVAEVDMANADALKGDMAALRRLAQACQAQVQIDAIGPAGETPEALAARLLVACALAGLMPAAVRACPAPFLKSHQPAGPWPVGPALEAYAAALAEVFPQARVGGGMLTYFTELNRKRQAPVAIAFVGHTTTPLVHAADDRSVMQTHQSLASIAASVHAIWPTLAYRLGPVTLGMHRNPYGERTADNPLRERAVMAPDDPRHQAAFGAAWLVGYVAAVQQSNIEWLSLLHSHGPSGPLLRQDMPDWQPGACVPAWRVLQCLVRASRCALHQVHGLPDGLAALGWAGDGGARHLLLANLGAEPVEAVVQGAWMQNDLSAPCSVETLEKADLENAGQSALLGSATTSLHFSAYQVFWLRQ